MYLHAESVTVDEDEGRFVLIIESEEEDPITVNIHNIDLDTFYDQVKGRIGPYLQEKEAAYSEFKTLAKAGAFRCDPDESGGVEERVVAIREDGSYRVEPDEDAYDPMDPKHPRFHSVHVNHYDNREKA